MVLVELLGILNFTVLVVQPFPKGFACLCVLPGAMLSAQFVNVSIVRAHDSQLRMVCDGKRMV